MEVWCGNQVRVRRKRVCIQRTWGSVEVFKIVIIRQNGKGCLQTPAKLLNRQMMQI